MFRKLARAVVAIGLFAFGSAFAAHPGDSAFPRDNSLDRSVTIVMTDTQGTYPEDNSRD